MVLSQSDQLLLGKPWGEIGGEPVFTERSSGLFAMSADEQEPLLTKPLERGRHSAISLDGFSVDPDNLVFDRELDQKDASKSGFNKKPDVSKEKLSSLLSSDVAEESISAQATLEVEEKKPLGGEVVVSPSDEQLSEDEDHSAVLEVFSTPTLEPPDEVADLLIDRLFC